MVLFMSGQMDITGLPKGRLWSLPIQATPKERKSGTFICSWSGKHKCQYISLDISFDTQNWLNEAIWKLGQPLNCDTQFQPLKKRMLS